MATKKDYSNRLEIYKWEFLRRNETYKQAYKKYIAYKKTKKYKEGDEEDVFHLYSEWGIRYPLDPSKTYRQNLSIVPSHIKQVFFPLPFYANTESGFGDDSQLVLGDFEIDLGFSDRAIVNFFKDYLKYYRKLFKKTARKDYQLQYKITKPKFEEYNRYLKTYDLCKEYELRKKKKPWNKIVKDTYPNEDSGDYTQWKAQRDYRICKKLIKDGFMVK